MNLITHKELKPRREYPRAYDRKGYLVSIDVSREEIEDLVSIGQVWNIIKFLTRKNIHKARFDITVGMVATDIAKQILVKEEFSTLNKNPHLFKENSALSKTTYIYLSEYIFELYDRFKRQGIATLALASQRVEYKIGNESIAFNELAYSIKATEEGLNLHF